MRPRISTKLLRDIQLQASGRDAASDGLVGHAPSLTQLLVGVILGLYRGTIGVI